MPATFEPVNFGKKKAAVKDFAVLAGFRRDFANSVIEAQGLGAISPSIGGVADTLQI